MFPPFAGEILQVSQNGSYSTSDETLQQSANVLPDVIYVVAPKSRSREQSFLRIDWKNEDPPFQDKKSGLRESSNDTPNFRVARRRQLEARDGVALKRVDPQASRSIIVICHHRNDVVFVPDYQVYGIEFLDDLCTFPQFTAVSLIFSSGR